MKHKNSNLKGIKDVSKTVSDLIQTMNRNGYNIAIIQRDDLQAVSHYIKIIKENLDIGKSKNNIIIEMPESDYPNYTEFLNFKKFHDSQEQQKEK